MIQPATETTEPVEAPAVSLPSEPGIYPGIEFDAYKTIPALNPSIIKHASKSMLHVKHAMDHPLTESTPSMLFGSATHTALFEGKDEFNRRYPVFHGKRKAGTEWDKFQEEHADRTEILKIDQAEKATEAAQRAIADPFVASLLSEGQSEVSILHTETLSNGAQVDCKGRVDWLRDDALVDLKTSADITPHLFGGVFARYHYHVQFGLYRRWLAELDGKRRKVYVIVQENKPPFDVYVEQVHEEILDYGERLGMQWIAQIQEATQTGVWPGIGDTRDTTLAFPDWAIDDRDVEVQFEG